MEAQKKGNLHYHGMLYFRFDHIGVIETYKVAPVEVTSKVPPNVPQRAVMLCPHPTYTQQDVCHGGFDDLRGGSRESHRGRT